ncbi:MAG: cobalt-precorrin 5A hydrolase [Selenomonadaceae bacterium]|nr:cobalt-precorrin 5A hydrolase [Selenomonadaceae bacterium]MBR1859453.1 cobalt-precorrin 5A hydrolase [Selenomonadaceae bacterium]
MRKIIFSITEKGAALAQRIAQKLDGCTIFIKNRDFDKLRDAVDDNFNKFDALIFISATGIAVRMIAPHVVSKLTDPAVIVIDELGQHVISLLSGHVGGANDLAIKIADIIEAEPVITTATDVNKKFAIDSVASKLGLMPEPKDAIKIINRAILNNEPIYVTAGDTVLNLTPLKLILGIGCKRGISKESIETAVVEACNKINQPIDRIYLIASVDVKCDEAGLIEFAASVNKRLKFFDVNTLKRTIERYNLSESEFVKRTIGVGNVCEAAALSCVKTGKFALTKTKFDGITVALIWSNNNE